MALLPNVFVPEEAKSSGFEPIPADWYEAELIKSELKTTKAKDGKYLAFCFKVIGGDHDGRMIWTNLNIVNKNETAVAIAQGDLKAICESVGHEGDLEDTEDLHDIPLAIKVSFKEETAQWPAKNEIKGYKCADELDS
tara:strand:- start:20602 stop:21015 length:414 start_codon:yes stop_codon:yes gene_type:complete